MNLDFLTNYGMQQFSSFCELCAGEHESHQCVYNRNYPNFGWSYNQDSMQQSHQPSYPFQDQQYGAEPYNPWEFQQQQFHTDYGQQSNEEAEMEELRMLAKSNALTLQRLQNQIGQIANALLNSPQGALPSDTDETLIDVETEHDDIPINLDGPFLAKSVPLIEVEKEELTMRVQDQIVTSNVFKAIQIPSEDEDCFSVEILDIEHSKEVDEPLKTNSGENTFQGKSDIEDEELAEHVQLLNAAHWHGSLNNPHESFGLEDLWNSQVRLKPSYEEPSILELKPVPDHFGYAYLGESYTLFVITTTNLSEMEEDKLLRVLREFKLTIGWSKPTLEHQRTLYPFIKEVAKEEILKWPMNFDMKAEREKKLLQLSKLDEFRHHAYVNSKLYKEQIKRWHDRLLAYKTLYPP